MLLTCVKNPMINKPRTLAFALAAAIAVMPAAYAAKKETSAVKTQTIELPEPGVITVSDYEFNTFAFSEPAKRVILPAGSPVTGEPITLAAGTQVLLQFAKGTDRPVQMVVELQSGKTERLRVLPKPIPGIVHQVNGAKLKPSVAAKTNSAIVSESQKSVTPRGADIELLKALTTAGEPPAEFDPVSLPRSTRFDKFSVVPMAGWSNGVKRILVFSLVAAQDQTAVVSPNQFYREGITAVLLDGDTVDANNSPQLFVVEEMNDE